MTIKTKLRGGTLAPRVPIDGEPPPPPPPPRGCG